MTKRTRLVVIAAIALLVVGGIGVFLLTRGDDAAPGGQGQPGGSGPSGAAAAPSSELGVGDCAKVNAASATAADLEKVGCDQREAVYKVGKKLDGGTATCPDGDYDTYTGTGQGAEFELCLLLNARQGDCFQGVASAEALARVGCGPPAEIQVVRIIDGAADRNACGSAAGDSLIYPDPPTTICATKP